MPLLKLTSIARSELDTPQPDRLITDRDALLCQQIFDVTKAQVESVVAPDCVADDAGMKAVSFVGTHNQIISTRELTCQYRNVTYQASWNGFEVPHELLNIPVRASSSKALFEAVHRCQDELTRLAKSQKLSAQVRSIMLERQNNLPSLAVIARMLNLTPRTLHRRLIDEGSSYRDIIEYVRHQLAMDYLLDQQITIKEIAFMLGYSDLASFRRAFKRWTGKTPSEYRTNSVKLT